MSGPPAPTTALWIDNIPIQLRDRPQWVNWRYEPVLNKPKPTKVPYNARTGDCASTTDPKTWSPFETALTAANRYDGIGYNLSKDDGLVGIDLDHCRDPETGAIEAWAREILGDTQSYTEISPSQCGLRIFVRGSLPDGRRKQGPLEMYDRARYLTVTGQRLEEFPAEIREPALPIAALHAKLFPAAAAPLVGGNGHSPSVPTDPDDITILARARQAKNSAKFSALWSGEVTSYPSPSEADLALCGLLAFWTGRDPGRIDELFRQSGLMRPKWDTRRGAETYGDRTIRLAISACREVYTAWARRGEEIGEVAPTWTLYDGAEVWGFPPPQPLIDGLLMLVGVTWVGGRPKSFKTLLVLYLCLCMAARRARAADHFKIHATPLILYVGREDGGARFESRLDEILAAWPEHLALGAIRFLIREHVDLLNPAHVAWLRDTCRREAITILVLDTWTALSPGADPMAAKDQAQLAAVIVQLAQDIAGQVIVIDHSRKNRPDGQPLSAADIFGPLQKWAAADNTIMLERVGSSSRVEVYIEGKDIDSSQCFLEVSPRGSDLEKFTYAGTVAELADAQRAVGDKNRQAVRLAVSSSALPLSSDAIRQRLLTQEVKLALDTVKNHVAALVQAGVLRSIGKGRATKYTVAVGVPSSTIASPVQEPLYDPAT
jgi:hypothetical protein